MDIDKIRDEMAALPAGSPLRLVGEYMTARVMAGAPVAANKTIKGAFEAIRAAASKMTKQAGCVAVSDADAWKIVDGYMGWPHQDVSPEAMSGQEAPEQATAPAVDGEPTEAGGHAETRATGLDELDALLEGL